MSLSGKLHLPTTSGRTERGARMEPQSSSGKGVALERLGSGRAAEVFAWTPGVVVKLVREARFDAGLEREATSLEAAARAGIPAPRPMGFVVQDGRLGLLMERIDGRDIFSLAKSQPWRAWSLGCLVGRLHVRLAAASAPASLANLRERVRQHIEESEHVPGRARGRLMAILEATSDGGQLCHMDFHPGNVMLTRQGAFIIDFPNALRGPAIADYAKSWVILRAGKPPGGSGLMDRYVAGLRKIILAGYVRGYRSACDVDGAELARWKAIQVAMRLEEGIPAERKELLRLLSRTLREAERHAYR